MFATFIQSPASLRVVDAQALFGFTRSVVGFEISTCSSIGSTPSSKPLAETTEQAMLGRLRAGNATAGPAKAESMPAVRAHGGVFESGEPPLFGEAPIDPAVRLFDACERSPEAMCCFTLRSGPERHNAEQVRICGNCHPRPHGRGRK